MFQLKKTSANPNPTNTDPRTNLPNNYGYIHTLKEDFENLQSGGEKSDEEIKGIPIATPQPNQPIPVAPVTPKIAQSQAGPPPSSINPTESKSPAAIPTGTESAKPIAPGSLGSETFFQTRSPFDEKAEAPKTNIAPAAPSKPKSSVIVTLLILFLFLAIAGGGVYYWWFFIKAPKKEISQPAQKTTPPAKNEQVADTKSSGDLGLQQWALDTQADKIANKLAIERYAKNLADSAVDNKAVEIKLISKDNQPITPQVFGEVFGFQLPVSVSEKLTGDYSLFMTKEHETLHLGAAFKLVSSPGLAESVKSEEASIVQGLQPFYLENAPAEAQISFSFGKYNNADIRYFNFPGPENISFDYTILSNRESSYFLFSTSKNSLRAILDYMSEK